MFLERMRYPTIKHTPKRLCAIIKNGSNLTSFLIIKFDSRNECLAITVDKDREHLLSKTNFGIVERQNAVKYPAIPYKEFILSIC